ncbi:hypothetical protein CAC42_5467 [Sphaceloma murrayae]|uniref:Sfi1 spindle body domain-containing protein n=1 Tax=Sphaceloma murrayae TaxID=2082308 RepID=A0A2K1QJH7_9PEZI|nr:hypothetical protein CAC42_5467 [Sphaceloma murrayae]
MPTQEVIDLLSQFDDEEVEIIYEIANLAQQSQQRPIRALHNAFDQILPETRTDPGRHSKLFRFISHAGNELARDGRSGLVKRFRALLAHLDVHLVTEGDDDGSELTLSDVRDERVVPRTGSSLAHSNRRRASFNDSNLDTTWISVDRLAGLDGTQKGPKHTLLAKQKSSRTRSASTDHHPVFRFTADNADDPVKSGQLQDDAHSIYFAKVARRFLWLWQARTRQARRRQQDLLQMVTNHDQRILAKQSFAELRDALLGSRLRQQQERRAVRARNLFLLTKAFTHWAQAASDEVVRTSVAKRHILRTRYFNAWRHMTTLDDLKCRSFGMSKWFGLWRSKTDTISTERSVATDFRRMHISVRYFRHWFFTICDRRAPTWKESRLLSSMLTKWRSRRDQLKTWSLAADGRHNVSLLKSHLASMRGRVLMTYDLETIAVNARRRQALTSHVRLWRRKTMFRPNEARASAAKDSRLASKALSSWKAVTEMIRRAKIINQSRHLARALTCWNEHLRTRILQSKINDRMQLQTLYKWVIEERHILFERIKDQRQKSMALQILRARIATRRFQLEESSQILVHNTAVRLEQHALIRLHASFRQRERDVATAVEFRNSKTLPRSMEHLKSQSIDTRQLNRKAGLARTYFLSTSTLKRWREATTESRKARRREAYVTIRRQHKTASTRRCLAAVNRVAKRLDDLRSRARQAEERKVQSVAVLCLDRWDAAVARHHADIQRADRMASQYRLQDALTALGEHLSKVTNARRQAEIFEQVVRERLASKMLKTLSDSAFLLRRQVDTAIAWRIRRFAQHQREMIRYWLSKAQGRKALDGVGDPDSPTKTPTMRASKTSKRASEVTHSSEQPLYRPGLPNKGQGDGWPHPDDLAEDTFALDQSNIIVSNLTPGYLRTPSRRTARTRARFRAIPNLSTSNASGAIGALDFGSSVLGSTTPAPYVPGGLDDMSSLTPQVTPFQRKLRAGGYQNNSTPHSGLGLTRGFAAATRELGTDRSVRFHEEMEEDDGASASRVEDSPSRT